MISTGGSGPGRPDAGVAVEAVVGVVGGLDAGQAVVLGAGVAVMPTTISPVPPSEFADEAQRVEAVFCRQPTESAAEGETADAAGLRSMSPFQTRRASSWPGSPRTSRGQAMSESGGMADIMPLNRHRRVTRSNPRRFPRRQKGIPSCPTMPTTGDDYRGRRRAWYQVRPAPAATSVPVMPAPDNTAGAPNVSAHTPASSSPLPCAVRSAVTASPNAWPRP